MCRGRARRGAPRPSRQTTPVGAARDRTAETNRLRSSCDSRRLSYSGRKRTGAGASGSGRGASGRSKSSRPRSSRKCDELRPQPFDHLAQAGQPAPRRDVRDRRGSERGEIAEHDRVKRRVGRERLPEPRLRCRPTHLGARPPEATRRHLHESKSHLAGICKRGRIELRKPRREERAQLGARPRLLERCPAGFDDGIQVDAAQVRREVSVPPELPLEDRLSQRAEQKAVVGRDQVDRPAHDADPHDVAVLEQLRERLRPELGEPRPEAGVRVARHLGLQADQMPHRVERRQLGTLEQQLAGERRPVQRLLPEDTAHAAILRKRVILGGRGRQVGSRGLEWGEVGDRSA